LVTSVNAAYNPTGTTGNFFDPTKTTAGTITVLSSVTPVSFPIQYRKIPHGYRGSGCGAIR
ncbi:MAG: hypothetical protein ABUL58_03825, partial [Steroidobacter sp.]